MGLWSGYKNIPLLASGSGKELDVTRSLPMESRIFVWSGGLLNEFHGWLINASVNCCDCFRVFLFFECQNLLRKKGHTLNRCIWGGLFGGAKIGLRRGSMDCSDDTGPASSLLSKRTFRQQAVQGLSGTIR